MVVIGDGCDGFGKSVRLCVNPCPLWDKTSVATFSTELGFGRKHFNK
jgi:hypothetical protein